ncbi:3,4-dihydroxy-2-butanone-4-phosphate synthase [Sulfurospirillum diekertiae]|uniref:3,4-dihydroxy-2-butanone 4-phosphate synthase n=1 Tax=Sulfurospirillum diekertiae TaxID=1854492 RepID=A0A290HA86_9BACT|nr:3,4-dihydroxy-2-butanone-4-phosphate synthase [Sulfurospirillum diekertiae]ATB68462.1 3,4-dihydroxy-2-butanone 4-phosphate synthase RibB [Sulfurospirillum diekertiae]QIR76318.1 3,4-dihydroxy-2-butanone-4-phosphate synthase [Sulfurospirillum diekertiae]QIR78948.1 3,4-dihydroxy-2-butanone-4-phosphate synthase [Sulfurospirillum diekertiae]
MNQICRDSSLHSSVKQAIASLQNQNGVIVMDNFNRENEADIIFHAGSLTTEQTALLIRECSGIVCLCLPPQKVDELELPMMVSHNESKFQTGFTITIEAKEGVTTGVSAQDRLTTIQAAIHPKGKAKIVSPGHVFPLRAKEGGVLERDGHTEASVDLMRLSGLSPYAVLCELTNVDGTMTVGDDIYDFAAKHGFPIVSIDEIIEYRKKHTL